MFFIATSFWISNLNNGKGENRARENTKGGGGEREWSKNSDPPLSPRQFSSFPDPLILQATTHFTQ